MSAGRRVYEDKGWRSVLAGLALMAFGGLCFWLALRWPGQANGWVPWVVGGMFAGVGLFTVFGRSRIVFDGATRTWEETWGFLFLRFRKRGRFDQLDAVVIEATVVQGFPRFYIWVKGGRSIRLLPEIEYRRDDADAVAKDLATLIDLPIRYTGD